MLIFDSTSPLLDAVIVTAKRGIGSFLTFDFKLDVKRSGQEDYHLWIYLTDWLITQNSKRLLDSEEESDALYEKVLRNFLGRKLLNFDVKDHSIKFEFEYGLAITLSPDCDFYEDTDELFLLFSRRENLVTCYTLENGLVADAITSPLTR